MWISTYVRVRLRTKPLALFRNMLFLMDFPFALMQHGIFDSAFLDITKITHFKVVTAKRLELSSHIDVVELLKTRRYVTQRTSPPQ